MRRSPVHGQRRWGRDRSAGPFGVPGSVCSVRRAGGAPPPCAGPANSAGENPPGRRPPGPLRPVASLPAGTGRPAPGWWAVPVINPRRHGGTAAHSVTEVTAGRSGGRCAGTPRSGKGPECRDERCGERTGARHRRAKPAVMRGLRPGSEQRSSPEGVVQRPHARPLGPRRQWRTPVGRLQWAGPSGQVPAGQSRRASPGGPTPAGRSRRATRGGGTAAGRPGG